MINNTIYKKCRKIIKKEDVKQNDVLIKKGNKKSDISTKNSEKLTNMIAIHDFLSKCGKTEKDKDRVKFLEEKIYKEINEVHEEENKSNYISNVVDKDKQMIKNLDDDQLITKVNVDIKPTKKIIKVIKKVIVKGKKPVSQNVL